MKYAEFEKAIHHLVCSASENARQAFALDTIRLLHDLAKDAIDTELTGDERYVLTKILAGITDRLPNELKQELRELDDSMSVDPVRAIELNSDLSELLCATDHWIDYRLSGNPGHITNLAINMVNSIDYHIGGDVEGYSIDNMLGSPAMVAEHNRQQQLLTPL